jgi:hemerythrin-like domain-containing protein
MDSISTRFDMYGPVHKALRLFMCDTLAAVGRLDIDDHDDLQRTVRQLRGLLEVLAGHIVHENDFIHPLLDACRPGSADEAQDDHALHRLEIEGLSERLQALLAAPSSEGQDILYHALARFVADQLAHMEHEEGAHQQLLWAHLSDAQLSSVHDRLVATVPPAEFGALLGWMLPALTPQQRAGMLGEMQRNAPPPVFDAVMDLARENLDARALAKLQRALVVQPSAPSQTTLEPMAGQAVALC